MKYHVGKNKSSRSKQELFGKSKKTKRTANYRTGSECKVWNEPITN